MELMRSQRNGLLEIIKINGLDPFNFEWDKEVGKGNIVSFLKYKDTDYLFGIKVSKNDFELFVSPGFELILQINKVRSWNDVVVSFQQWLFCLEREISQPDLWEELEKIKLDDFIPELDGFEFEEEYAGQEFSYREVVQIQEGINNIRDYLVEVSDGNTEEIKIINQRLDYLTDAVKRMGRTDWKNIFIGVMIDIGINIISDPAQRKIIGQMIQNMFSGIVKLISV